MAFLIRIDIKTIEPVLFPRSRQQGNHFPGLDYIPGSAIRGALAGSFVMNNMESRIEPLLGHGFLISNFHTTGTIPIPLTLRKCKRYVENTQPKHKTQNVAIDQIDHNPCDCSGPLVSKSGFLRKTDGSYKHVEHDGDTRLVTHNRIDPETGTTSGRDAEGKKTESANLYSAEVLEMEQTFRGFLSWTDKDLRDELIRSDALSKVGVTLMLGKMKGKGYGHCRITGIETIDNSTVGRELMKEYGFQPNGKPTSITVLQDTLCLDDYLQSCATPRKSDLLPDISIKDDGSWVDFRTVHGFNVKRGVLSPPESALVAGSTFLTESFSTESAIRLEEAGIGARRCDGFGIVVCGFAELIKAQEVWS